VYIRFVVSEIHKKSQKRLGIFHAIRYLRDDGKMLPYEEEHTYEVMDWFEKNLDKPSGLSKAKSNHSVDKALTWFKDSATEHISKMWEFVAVLEAHNIKVDVIKEEKLGYIVYEDDFQVAAEPFKETKT